MPFYHYFEAYNLVALVPSRAVPPSVSRTSSPSPSTLAFQTGEERGRLGAGSVQRLMGEGLGPARIGFPSGSHIRVIPGGPNTGSVCKGVGRRGEPWARNGRAVTTRDGREEGKESSRNSEGERMWSRHLERRGVPQRRDTTSFREHNHSSPVPRLAMASH